jgi:hypothetical protein
MVKILDVPKLKERLRTAGDGFLSHLLSRVPDEAKAMVNLTDVTIVTENRIFTVSGNANIGKTESKVQTYMPIAYSLSIIFCLIIFGLMFAGCTHKMKTVVVDDEQLFKDLKVVRAKQGELNALKD